MPAVDVKTPTIASAMAAMTGMKTIARMVFEFKVFLQDCQQPRLHATVRGKAGS
jgi:hypothetical protein